MPGIARADRRLTLPLSFAQQRLWLLDRLLPLRSVYNVARGLRLVGELDVGALRAALNEVVRRQEALRTSFGMRDAEPVQLIAPELALPLEAQDLNEVPEPEREEAARRCAQEEAREPFDLSRAPLFRARLLRLRETEHWFLLTLHHAITDGWSIAVFWRELLASYEARCRGASSPLPELPVQYADYAVWQRDWLHGAVLEKQLGYWKRALAELPVLALPTDRPRPATPSYRGGRFGFPLDAKLTQALRESSGKESVTLFTTLLAAFEVLLYRYSGQEDVAVGVPVAGRVRPEVAGLIGFFVNTLVMRGDMSGDPGFGEHLRRVHTRAQEAYAHQDVPFEKVVEALHPQRDPSRNPLYQVFFNKPPRRMQALQAAGITADELADADTGSAKFDLEFTVFERHERCDVIVEYADDLFESSTIERMAGHFRTLLAGIVADPGQRISRLPLLTEAEQRQLAEWNDTVFDYPREVCIHSLFEAQVARTPDTVAAVFGDQRLTYAELNRRANRLAHQLRVLGVGPEVLVGLCLEPSLELVVGLLGILKAGGVYVPLDPSYPPARLAFMLDDASATVLLTQESLLGSLPSFVGRTLCLDRDWAAIAAHPESNLACTATAVNLAYVIYTSGSTGTPKGVMIEHGSLVNHFRWMIQRFCANAADCVLQTAPIGFDQSVWQMLFPLLSGGRVALPDPGAHRSPDEIVDLASRHGVTILRIVPSMLEAILRGPGLGRCESLRLVISAGEALESGVAARFLDGCGAELVNAYGPTETTFVTTLWTCIRQSGQGAIPIGNPIGNARIHLLDSHGQPVPPGVHGEVCIAGAGVGRGYWRRGDLAAEKFVPDPFSTDSDARMYRSGDIARRRADGRLEFLGRRDQQVKIRGVRIELGEIEATLAAHVAVANCVVNPWVDSLGETRLAAYVVAREDAVIATTELRDFLRGRLPPYMVPPAYVSLPRLPLTPNGKVDRRGLPSPERESLAVDDTGFVAPRAGIEAQVASHFAELLGLEAVGVHSDFFELGGHSLLAMRLLARIEESHRVRVSAGQFFRDPTVAGLASNVESARRSAGNSAGATGRVIGDRSGTAPQRRKPAPTLRAAEPK